MLVVCRDKRSMSEEGYGGLYNVREQLALWANVACLVISPWRERCVAFGWQLLTGWRCCSPRSGVRQDKPSLGRTAYRFGCQFLALGVRQDKVPLVVNVSVKFGSEGANPRTNPRNEGVSLSGGLSSHRFHRVFVELRQGLGHRGAEGMRGKQARVETSLPQSRWVERGRAR